MNEEYLWDKSGEPDPTVQQLEEILGTLRYQPRPLEIPGDLRVAARRSYFPMLAIAATIALALLAGGLWLLIKTPGVNQHSNAKNTVETGTAPAPPVQASNKGPREGSRETIGPPHHRLKAGLVATNLKRTRKASGTPLEDAELAEALAAKQQLMVALRLASEKFNLAQKRTQNSSPLNLIRNQHKLG
jgi:hypothetical protein